MKKLILLTVVVGVIALVVLLNSEAKSQEFGFSFSNERYLAQPVVPRLYFYYGSPTPGPYYGQPLYQAPPYVRPYNYYHSPYHGHHHHGYGGHGYHGHRGHEHGDHGRGGDRHGRR